MKGLAYLMAETQIINPICGDDCEGERGERGKRGRRGHRGHDGHDGATGPTGPTGTTGPSAGALIGRQVFDVAGSGTYTPTPGTRSAIVRGCGAGGGGGGVLGTPPAEPAVGAGGNSGTAIEVEVIAPPNTLLTGGPVVVGTGGAGGTGLPGDGADGGDSTLLIGGTLLTAPGGKGGRGGGNSTSLNPGPFANNLAFGVDYQAFDLGGNGFTKVRTAASGFDVVAGNGGSGDYGGGGNGSTDTSDGLDGRGNGAGGGGAGNGAGNPTITHDGGDGAPGLWIIEEYS